MPIMSTEPEPAKDLDTSRSLYDEEDFKSVVDRIDS